jgi:hypothetical protein
MEIATQPDIYTPGIDEHGNYVDKTPSFNIMRKGVLCPCGSRKDKAYTNNTFSSHIKTKIHQKWLSELNVNKSNYYVENEKNKELIQNQRLIIATLEKDLQNQMRTITYLTKQLTIQNQPSKEIDLLDFD